ncbi:MAG: hypothetical protein R2705_09025 [Ilumatobacteraceae bacterium]
MSHHANRLLISATSWVRDRRHGTDPEAGVETVEILSWSAMSVVAIVAIGALVQALGVDVVNYVRAQIGL